MSDNLLYRAPVTYEPLRNNRFMIKFPSDTGIQTWWVSTSNMPAINQNAVEMPFLNTSTWVLGRYTWDDLNITFRNFEGPSTVQALMSWIRLGSESVTGRQGYAAGYKRNFTIEMLDPNGVSVQKWVVVNAFIATANFGNLDHSDDAISTIECSIKYDYAINLY